MTTHLIPQNKIHDLIPQKSPIVMVDALFDFSEKHVKTGFTILESNIFVQNNHFQASGIIEHMAQSIALHTGYAFYLQKKPAPMGYIGSIKKIDILALPKTGENLTTDVKIIQEFMGITLVEINTFSGERHIAKGQMKTVLAQK